ncbi:MAG: sigma-54 dependent transcriptional regulator [Acidobacteriota bacterium]
MASTKPSIDPDLMYGSTASHSRVREQSGVRPLVALTILAHPQVGRVGERTTLPALTSGKSVELSRLNPWFAPPTGGRAQPLADRYLSRRPVVLAADGENGFVLSRGAMSKSLELDGLSVEHSRRVSEQDLERGLTLVLADRVALFVHRLEIPAAAEVPPFGLVGESPAMRRLRHEIHKVAHHPVSVLIRGETGTGKELVARAIHRASPRASSPLVAVNLGALPPSLAAAELFGSVRGGFTGAEKRVGLFQRADGGTLFLDEIGEAPTDVQVLLLRALESCEIQPVGAAKPSKVDVRVLAATDASLEAAIADGRFKAPLFHRLSGYCLDLPTVRRRRDDIGRLLFHFVRLELERIGQAHRLEDERKPWLSARLVARWARHAWPGNVRELRNAARRLVIGGLDETQDELERSAEEILGSSGREPGGPPSVDGSERQPSAPAPLVPAERRGPPRPYRSPHEVSEDELIAALRAHRFRLKPAAEQLGVSRASLYVLIDRSERVRRGSDIEASELEASYARHDGDLDSMADELEISRYAIQQRLREIHRQR